MDVNLSSLDLNLFHVLHVVLEEGSATRAAARLHVTQSAVSNALARLREVLGDPLVVRSGRGLVPTPLALELGPQIAMALVGLERVVQRAAQFDPQATTRTFTLAMADHWQLSELPRVLARLAEQAPRAQLQVASIDQLLATDGLRTGAIDAALRPTHAAGPGWRTVPLFDEDFVLVLRKGHPVGARPPPQALFEHPVVDVQISGPGSVGRQRMIEHLDAAGITPRVLVSVPSFVAAAMAVARTDAVAVLPRRLAVALVAGFALEMLPLPFQAPPLEIALVWHERCEADPGNRFFRELVVAALRA